MTSPSVNINEKVDESEIEMIKHDWFQSLKIQLKPKAKLTLPVSGERNVLITSALPYVNNVPHLGNVIGCVLSADVFARYCRICNYNTLYICGTDEYGTATETKALQEGLTPSEICNKYFQIHDAIYKWFNISFDKFGRTSTPEQTETVQEIFMELYKKNYMTTETIEQLKCEKCDRFLADRFVEGTCPHPGCGYEDARGDQCDSCGRLVNAIELINPRCNLCSTTPVIQQSEQFFFDMPQIEEKLNNWMNESSIKWSNNAKIIGKSYIKDGLKKRCITRDLKWGIPVPLEKYKDKVFYVWFDAPIGYISITKSLLNDDWVKWWKNNEDVELYQFMAKDNVPFHAVMFPATLLGINQQYTLVSGIMATEYLNYEDGKFSKSRGIGVFGTDVQSTGIEADIWRFYLLYVRPENQDSSFSWEDLALKINNELLNNFGNFVNRILSFAEKFFDGIVPEMINYQNDDWNFLALCSRHVKNYVIALESAKLRDGIRCILSISKLGNQYFQLNKPWELIKGDKTNKERVATIIGMCCNLIYLLSILLNPYMPGTCEKIIKQLNKENDPLLFESKNPAIRYVLKNGHKLGVPEPLFTKLSNEKIQGLKHKFGNKETSDAVNDVLESLTQAEIDQLRQDIGKQGEKIRLLKSQNVLKADLIPEINILLNLKKKLAASEVKK